MEAILLNTFPLIRSSKKNKPWPYSPNWSRGWRPCERQTSFTETWSLLTSCLKEKTSKLLILVLPLNSPKEKCWIHIQELPATWLRKFSEANNTTKRLRSTVLAPFFTRCFSEPCPLRIRVLLDCWTRLNRPTEQTNVYPIGPNSHQFPIK